MGTIKLGELSFGTLADVVEETLKKETADKEELKTLLHETLQRARKYRHHTDWLLGKLEEMFRNTDCLFAANTDKGTMCSILEEFDKPSRFVLYKYNLRHIRRRVGKEEE